MYKGKNVAYKFIEVILGEYGYCKRIMKKHFNKNLVMSVDEEEKFQLANSCLNCNKLFDVGDEKVRDHCHVAGKYRDAAHFSCNANCKLSKKVERLQLRAKFETAMVSCLRFTRITNSSDRSMV